jgi:hypothetical protein
MRPRIEEEPRRGKTTCFVCFVHRKDAEKAIQRLNGHKFRNDSSSEEMRVGWAKMPPGARPGALAPRSSGSSRSSYERDRHHEKRPSSSGSFFP